MEYFPIEIEYIRENTTEQKPPDEKVILKRAFRKSPVNNTGINFVILSLGEQGITYGEWLYFIICYDSFLDGQNSFVLIQCILVYITIVQAVDHITGWNAPCFSHTVAYLLLVTYYFVAKFWHNIHMYVQCHETNTNWPTYKHYESADE